MKRLCLLTLILLCYSAFPQGPTPTTDSCRQFTQAFYDWYVARVLEENQSIRAWEIAINEKKSYFDAELASRLHEDLDAQKRAKGGLLGLDWDPFLNSQDPAVRYKVGKASLKGKRCDVDVRDAESSAPGSQPDVFVELKFDLGSWKFINFVYNGAAKSSPHDLLEALKILRRSRAKTKSGH